MMETGEWQLSILTSCTAHTKLKHPHRAVPLPHSYTFLADTHFGSNIKMNENYEFPVTLWHKSDGGMTFSGSCFACFCVKQSFNFVSFHFISSGF